MSQLEKPLSPVLVQALLLGAWRSPNQAVGQGQECSSTSPVTMYWESPENAQSHIQPRDVSPGLLLLMLSSVIREKFEVLQILQV